MIMPYRVVIRRSSVIMDTEFAYFINQGSFSVSCTRAIIFLCNFILLLLEIRIEQVCQRPFVDLIIKSTGTDAILTSPTLNKVAKVDLGPGRHEGNLPVEEIEDDPDNGCPLRGFDCVLRLQGGGELPNRRHATEITLKGNAGGMVERGLG